MPDEAAQQFLAQAQTADLLSAEAVERVGSALLGQAVTADEVAAHLVRDRVLTSFQAEQLLAGRAEDCVLAGRYHLLESLGAGGMGTVYRARDAQLNRLVAVKVMATHLISDPRAVARFQREARALAQVSHPAIVQAFDAGQHKGQHFLVMEFVSGVSLGQVLKDEGCLTPSWPPNTSIRRPRRAACP